MKKLLKTLNSLFFLFLIFHWVSNSFAEDKIIFRVRIEGAITPVIANFLAYCINLSEERQAQALIVELDTPGGLVESTREVVKEMLRSRIPVVVYVSPPGARAASAGTFILIASHLAAMAPGTHVGAAHPVELTGKADEKVLEKISQDLVAWGKNLAQMRNRNPKFIEEAVLKSKSITEKEALELKVIDLIAKDFDELLKEIDGKTVMINHQKVSIVTKNSKVEIIEEDFKTKFLKVLTNPNLIYFLLMLGLAGIYFELSHPGSIFPGVIGAICLILAFLGLSILPLNYAGLALILLAGLLFFLETQIASHGLLTLAGTVSLLLGSLILFGKNPPPLKVYQPFLYTVVITFSIIFAGITYLAVRVLKKKPVSGGEALVGKVGKALEEISPQKGKIFVEGEIWEAISDEIIPKGEQIKVIEKRGFTLRVKPHKE